MSLEGLDLFHLLPAVYRTRDAQLAQSLPLLTPEEAATLAALQLLTTPLSPPLPPDQQALFDELTAKASRGPLESLLLVIQEQMTIVAENLDQLYDDQFIETCAPWVIPYIGDLIGYRSVKGIAPSVDNPRSEVANTISFRRRKGTVLVLEELARDATGWGAHAVEFFRTLGDTQYMNHIRPHNHYAPDLRRWKQCGYPEGFISTGFDRTSHKVDVRRIADTPLPRGRYNIQNIGIFLWSLGAWSVTRSPATPLATNAPGSPDCFRFSSLGMDIPLFHKAISQGAHVQDPCQPHNVPDRLQRRALCEDIQRGVGATYYGPGNSLVVSLDHKPLNPFQIRIADLAGPDGAWANLPTGNAYAAVIDPRLGRLALPAVPPGARSPIVEVSYEYGFNADLGGGEYPRAAQSGADRAPGFIVTNPARIVPFPDTSAAPRYLDLQGAVDFAIAELAQTGSAAVEIVGSQTISLPTGLTVKLPAGTTLELRAADGSRPTLLLGEEIAVTGDTSSAFTLNGLLVAASPATVPANPSPVALLHAPAQAPDGSWSHLAQLNLVHCTLLPGWSVDPHGKPLFPTQPTLLAEPAGLAVGLTRSIVGPLRAARLVTVAGLSTILDAADPTGIAYTAPDGGSGGALTLVGCTVIGKVHASLLNLVSDSIFWGWRSAADIAAKLWPSALIADRRQAGCVRFSYLPHAAVTPRRFQCVEQAPDTPQPLFFALRYGLPGYAKLLASTSDRIRRGAEDGGEMGVFHYLLNPLRETDLRIRLQEYIPVGMEFGLIYQN